MIFDKHNPTAPCLSGGPTEFGICDANEKGLALRLHLGRIMSRPEPGFRNHVNANQTIHVPDCQPDEADSGDTLSGPGGLPI